MKSEQKFENIFAKDKICVFFKFFHMYYNFNMKKKYIYNCTLKTENNKMPDGALKFDNNDR